MNESKIRAYYIQRSSDGFTFADIGTIAARNTASNEYSFTDDQALPGRNYYRLRIVDVDGKVEFSKIMDAGLKASGNFHVYTIGKTLRISMIRTMQYRSQIKTQIKKITQMQLD